MFDSSHLGKCWQSQGCVCFCFGKCFPEPRLILIFPPCSHATLGKPALAILLTPGGLPIHFSRRTGGRHGALLGLSHDLSTQHPHSSAGRSPCIRQILADWAGVGSQLELGHWLQLPCSYRSAQCSDARIWINHMPALNVVWATPTTDRGEICTSQRCKVIRGTGTLTLLLALWCWQVTFKTAQHDTLHAGDTDLQLNCFLFPDIMCCDRDRTEYVKPAWSTGNGDLSGDKSWKESPVGVIKASAARAKVICNSVIFKQSQIPKMGGQSLAPDREVVEGARDSETRVSGRGSRVLSLCPNISTYFKMTNNTRLW